MIFDPFTSPERQEANWTCSIDTSTWLLRSVGVAVSQAEMQRWMVPGLVNPDLGLLSGSGYQLAGWLRERFGVPVERHEGSWDWLLEHAGQGPIGIGSSVWYHWAAVRYRDGDTLALMNPAPGHMGVYDTMNYGQYIRLRPFTALWIPVLPMEDEEVSRVSELESLLGEMQRVAREVILPDVDKALEQGKTKAEILETLQYGIKPALETIIRGE